MELANDFRLQLPSELVDQLELRTLPTWRLEARERLQCFAAHLLLVPNQSPQMRHCAHALVTHLSVPPETSGRHYEEQVVGVGGVRVWWRRGWGAIC